jgi:hypothetical protein
MYNQLSEKKTSKLLNLESKRYILVRQFVVMVVMKMLVMMIVMLLVAGLVSRGFLIDFPKKYGKYCN